MGDNLTNSPKTQELATESHCATPNPPRDSGMPAASLIVASHWAGSMCKMFERHCHNLASCVLANPSTAEGCHASLVVGTCGSTVQQQESCRLQRQTRMGFCPRESAALVPPFVNAWPRNLGVPMSAEHPDALVNGGNVGTPPYKMGGC